MKHYTGDLDTDLAKRPLNLYGALGCFIMLASLALVCFLFYTIIGCAI